MRPAQAATATAPAAAGPGHRGATPDVASTEEAEAERAARRGDPGRVPAVRGTAHLTGTLATARALTVAARRPRAREAGRGVRRRTARRVRVASLVRPVRATGDGTSVTDVAPDVARPAGPSVGPGRARDGVLSVPRGGGLPRPASRDVTGTAVRARAAVVSVRTDVRTALEAVPVATVDDLRTEQTGVDRRTAARRGARRRDAPRARAVAAVDPCAGLSVVGPARDPRAPTEHGRGRATPMARAASTSAAVTSDVARHARLTTGGLAARGTASGAAGGPSAAVPAGRTDRAPGVRPARPGRRPSTSSGSPLRRCPTTSRSRSSTATCAGGCAR